MKSIKSHDKPHIQVYNSAKVANLKDLIYLHFLERLQCEFYVFLVVEWVEVKVKKRGLVQDKKKTCLFYQKRTENI